MNELTRNHVRANLDDDALPPAAQFAEHVRGFRIFATDALLDRGEDWTTAGKPRPLARSCTTRSSRSNFARAVTPAPWH